MTENSYTLTERPTLIDPYPYPGPPSDRPFLCRLDQHAWRYKDRNHRACARCGWKQVEFLNAYYHVPQWVGDAGWIDEYGKEQPSTALP